VNIIRVVSDGTSFGTRVYLHDSETGADVLMDGVIKIELFPIERNRNPSARITFAGAALDVIAES
jgi:hypothetical protein